MNEPVPPAQMPFIRCSTLPALEIDNLGVLAAQFNSNVRLRRVMLQGGGNGDDLLDEGHLQMLGQGQAAAARDDGRELHFTQLLMGLAEKRRQSLLDIGKMPFIIGKEQLLFLIQNSDIFTVVEPISIPRVYTLLFIKSHSPDFSKKLAARFRRAEQKGLSGSAAVWRSLH